MSLFFVAQNACLSALCLCVTLCVALFVRNQSFALLLNFKEKVELRFVELGAVAVYWLWFCTLASYTESGTELLAYVVLSHGVSGILHVQVRALPNLQ